MTNLKKVAPATKPVVAEVSPVMPPDVAIAEPATPAAAIPATAAAGKARPARKPSKEDEVVAKHQKVLAEALVMAQAINYDQPKVMRQAAVKGKKAAQPAKPDKAKKPKLVRDSYAMPEAEYGKIGELKKRLAALGAAAKKSELLRGGIAVLAAMNDAELKAVMARVARIKTGRPAK